ncbi:hypothetical protein BJX64DRAFT_271681 [Aspergillus heterothallicus]
MDPPRMPNACLSCAAKKRKCDRAFPNCSRCSRSRIGQACEYRGAFDDQFLRTDSGQFLPNVQQLKSAVSCEKCRAGKRACSRELPTCSRCERCATLTSLVISSRETCF